MCFILTFEFSPSSLKVLSYSVIWGFSLWLLSYLLSARYYFHPGDPLCFFLPMVLPTHPPSPAGFYTFKLLEFHSFVSSFTGQTVFSFVFYFVSLCFWDEVSRSPCWPWTHNLATSLELLFLLTQLPENWAYRHQSLFYVANISFFSDHTIFPVSRVQVTSRKLILSFSLCCLYTLVSCSVLRIFSLFSF